MSKERNQFTKVNEVIAIHLERYNRQIQRLLDVEDYCEFDLQCETITRKEYYRARERKIKAYNDCLVSMYQKERLLQYHNTGFQLEVIEEKTEINHTLQPKFNVDLLTFEEATELYNLHLAAKKQQNYLPPIIPVAEPEQKLLENHIEDEVTNIYLIKREEEPANRSMLTAKVDPVQKLKDAINKLAAMRFKEAGAMLDEEEEKILAERI